MLNLPFNSYSPRTNRIATLSRFGAGYMVVRVKTNSHERRKRESSILLNCNHLLLQRNNLCFERRELRRSFSECGTDNEEKKE